MNFNALSTRLRVVLVGTVSLLFFAAGCSSSGSSHLLYVATGNGIFGYRINNNSGASTAVFTAPFVVGDSPSAIVITPSNQFAYVTNQQDNTISLLKVDASSGSLSEILPRTATGISPGTMIMDAPGSFLFVADQGSNDVEAFSIGSNGSLSLKSTVSVGSSPSALALSSSGNLLFVAVPNFNAIYVFSVSSGTMTPVANSPFLIASGVASVTIDSSSTFLYVPNPGANTITGFAINSGALTPLPGSPYGTTVTGNQLDVPVALAIDPAAKFLYAANFAVTNVSGFTIASNGDLTALTSAAGTAGNNPNLITFDSGGRFLYVGNLSSITEFSIDSSGILSATNTIQVGTVPRSLAFTK